jgi:hypothetical protein
MSGKTSKRAKPPEFKLHRKLRVPLRLAILPRPRGATTHHVRIILRGATTMDFFVYAHRTARISSRLIIINKKKKKKRKNFIHFSFYYYYSFHRKRHRTIYAPFFTYPVRAHTGGLIIIAFECTHLNAARPPEKFFIRVRWPLLLLDSSSVLLLSSYLQHSHSNMQSFNAPATRLERNAARDRILIPMHDKRQRFSYTTRCLGPEVNGIFIFIFFPPL